MYLCIYVQVEQLKEIVLLHLYTLTMEYVSISLCIYLSMSIYLFIHFNQGVCIYLPMYLSMYVSICLSIYLYTLTKEYASLSLCIYLSMYLSLYVSICLSIYLYTLTKEYTIYLSIYLQDPLYNRVLLPTIDHLPNPNIGIYLSI
jgi:hypothetical protein